MKAQIDSLRAFDVNNIGNGKYSFFLYANPIEIVGEQTQWEVDLYKTSEMDFKSEAEAIEFVTVNFDLLIEACRAQEECELAQNQAQEAQSQLNATDYIDTQLNRIATLYGLDSEEYLSLREKRLPLLMQREQWTEIVRRAR